MINWNTYGIPGMEEENEDENKKDFGSIDWNTFGMENKNTNLQSYESNPSVIKKKLNEIINVKPVDVEKEEKTSSTDKQVEVQTSKKQDLFPQTVTASTSDVPNIKMVDEPVKDLYTPKDLELEKQWNEKRNQNVFAKGLTSLKDLLAGSAVNIYSKIEGIKDSIVEGDKARKEQLKETEQSKILEKQRRFVSGEMNEEEKKEYLANSSKYTLEAYNADKELSRLYVADTLADLATDSVNGALQIAINVINFFDPNKKKENFQPLMLEQVNIPDYSPLKNTEAYGEYETQEDLTQAIQEKKKQYYIDTNTYNPTMNAISEIGIDIASFALMKKAGMPTTNALVTSGVANTLGDTGDIEQASQSAMQSYIFGSILNNAKLSTALRAPATGASKFRDTLISKFPSLTQGKISNTIMQELPNWVGDFSVISGSNLLAGEAGVVLNNGKLADMSTQKQLLLNSVIWGTAGASLKSYSRVKFTFEKTKLDEQQLQKQLDSWYDSLQLEKGKKYSLDDVKKQYRNLAKQYHPDVAGANEKMININLAYEGLSKYLEGNNVYSVNVKSEPMKNAKSNASDKNTSIQVLEKGKTTGNTQTTSVIIDTAEISQELQKAVADSITIPAITPIIQNEEVIGFEKKDAMVFNIENSKVDSIKPAVVANTEKQNFDVIDLNSGSTLLTNQTSPQSAVEETTKILQNVDDISIREIEKMIYGIQEKEEVAIDVMKKSIEEKLENMPKTSNAQIAGQQDTTTIKRQYQKEIATYKEKSAKLNKVNDGLVEINTNIFENVSKKKQANILNEYLKNEVKGKDYYVDGEKIIANKYTVGKLVHGNTLFDSKINRNLRDELKANVITNIEDIVKSSRLYQFDRPDTKNHTFADYFDRRKSVFSYKGQNYEVMFEIGKKNGKNTLYGIEHIKKISNSLSQDTKKVSKLPVKGNDPTVPSNNITQNNNYVKQNREKSVASTKKTQKIGKVTSGISKNRTSKTPIKGGRSTVPSNNITQNNNYVELDSNNKIDDFGEKIGGARKDLAMERGKKTSKEVIHDYTVSQTDNGYAVNFKNKLLKDEFKTQEEAEEYIIKFKDTIKSNMVKVEQYGEKYRITILNSRTLKNEYTGKVFENKADAESYAIALNIYLKEHGKNLYRPAIQKVVRLNPNLENAKKATGNDILTKFGFKGGEFGNWVNQKERQEFLNYAEDAFSDLAIALDVQDIDLGQNKQMNIAFGARGQGLTGAVAHFEPVKRAINMTRLKGAGSLAHEYGHSLDNYISRVSGFSETGFVSSNRGKGTLSENMKKAVYNLVDSIDYNISTNQEEIDKKNEIYEKRRIAHINHDLKHLDSIFEGKAYKYKRINGGVQEVPYKITAKQKQDYQKIRTILENGKLEGTATTKIESLIKVITIYPEAIENLAKIHKEITGRKMDDETKRSLYYHGKRSKQITSVKSESAFSKNAVELDRATGRKTAYFSTMEEKIARSFEAFVSDELKSKGITNTYLVHGVDNDDYALFNPYPSGEERKNINNAWRNLIATIKEEKIFNARSTKSNATHLAQNKHKRTSSSKTTNKSYSNIQALKMQNENKASNSGILYMRKNKYNNYTKKEIENLQSPKIRIANSENDVLKFIENAKKMPSNLKLYFGKISNEIANKIQEQLGITVTNYNISLKADTIRHIIMGNHENSHKEILRGQLSITEQDFLKIPDIINNPEMIEYAGLTEQGKTAIKFQKNIDGNIIVVTYVSDKHNNIEIQTMYKFKNNKKRSVSPASNALNALNSTSKTVSSIAPNNNIPQNTKNVKNDENGLLEKYNSNITQGILSANKTDRKSADKTYAERDSAFIEQEIRELEKTGKWDKNIPMTSRAEILRKIEQFLDSPVRKGLFRQRAYAIYKTKDDIIRTRELKDIDSISHELGHAIDARYNPNKTQATLELLDIIDGKGYDKKDEDTLLSEGWAEAFRQYLSQPEKLKELYPDTAQLIQNLRNNDKKLDDFIADIQQSIYNYIHQTPDKRVLSNMSINEKEAKDYSWNAIKNKVIKMTWDKDYSLKSTVDKLAQRAFVEEGENSVSGNLYTIKPSQNAYYLLRLASGRSDKIQSMLQDGIIDTKTGEQLSPGLSELGSILGNKSSRWNDLRTYLMAKRDKDYQSAGLITGMRRSDTDYVVKKFENDTKIQHAAELIYENLDGVLMYAVKEGFLTIDDVKSMKENNLFYVPMQRVKEGREGRGVVGTTGEVQNAIKHRTGSELDIIDVLENIITNSAYIIQQIENNEVIRTLYELGEEAGFRGDVYDVVAPPMKKLATAELEMFKKELEDQGVDIENLDLNSTIDIWIPNTRTDKDRMITSFIRKEDGKRVFLQFYDKEVFSSVMGMNSKLASQVAKISRTLNMPLRYGATMANLDFAIPNMLSDTAQAFLYSDATFVPVVDNVIGVLDVLAATNPSAKKFLEGIAPEYARRTNKLYNIYQQSSASASGRMSPYRTDTQNKMGKIYGTTNKTLGVAETKSNQTTKFGKMVETVENKSKPLARLLDILTYLPELSETSTRFRNFEKEYNLYKKKGMEETDARIKAAINAKDITQDFNRMGTVMQEVNQYIPFSAARVGSSYRF